MAALARTVQALEIVGMGELTIGISSKTTALAYYIGIGSLADEYVSPIETRYIVYYSQCWCRFERNPGGSILTEL